ncbi:MAG: glycoside hydrolase family 13 protein [Bifidobacterium sp.]|jgi:alpha-glucosidase|nr:glycoside hydrolase family 13 protein [Bifidobacterium sp.]MCI1864871.1 glycoside hydrolase family 13 protein [Bifidobacterium sp.]
MTSNNTHKDWWKQAVVYQIYPRSFKDSDGDGLGDIAGITSRMGYLRDLGVDAIWLSPFYPSELADGGYDVIDYRDVDPRLGTMDDFDAMVAAAHSQGLKVVVDIVPNHTSDRHPWFQEALGAAPGSAQRERYIFREGRGCDGEIPPNDWLSMFGGSAWQRVDDGQWYLHLFARQQPDLNWKNPDVHEDFIRTLRFWSDHGTDGFRVDVAHGLAKDLSSRSLEELGRWPSQAQPTADGDHPLWDRPEVHDIYREWRRVFDEYDPPRFAIAEAWVAPEHQHLYASEKELGQVFNFEFAKANWCPQELRTAIVKGLDCAREAGSTTTWVMSNHDVPRHASRYALPQVRTRGYHQIANDWLLRNGESYIEDRDRGTRRARAAIMLEAGLPGSVYVYQGEELGLFEVADLPWDRLEDPQSRNSRGPFCVKGRDGCRVPLPWRADDEPRPAAWNPKFGEGASFGFSPQERAGSPACEPHLPQPLWFRHFAVDREDNDPTSMLQLYRKALSLRQTLLTATRDTGLTLLTTESFDDRSTIAYSRMTTRKDRRFVSITNFGSEPVPLPHGTVVLASADPLGDSIPQDTTVWMLTDV